MWQMACCSRSRLLFTVQSEMFSIDASGNRGTGQQHEPPNREVDVMITNAGQAQIGVAQRNDEGEDENYLAPEQVESAEVPVSVVVHSLAEGVHQVCNLNRAVTQDSHIVNDVAAVRRSIVIGIDRQIGLQRSRRW